MTKVLSSCWLWLAKKFYSLPRLRPVFKVGFKRLKRDKREYDWFLQRRKHGFDERATWSLDSEILRFTLPRLEFFRDICPVVPFGMTEDAWKQVLDDMLYAIRAKAKAWDGPVPSDPGYKEHNARVAKGWQLFTEYFSYLWW